METLDKKQMILEHNFRLFLRDEGLKEFEFRNLKHLDFVGRWDEGPRIVDKNVTPVVINFSCLDDQALVWNALNGGCKTNCIKVTKDSRTLKEKENFFKTFISQRKVNKPEKKSNYHANCGGPDGHHDHDHDH